METLACLIGGLCLIGFGAFLFRLRPPDWQSDGDVEPINLRAFRRCAAVQRGVRWANNLLLMLIGAGIAASGFVPHGKTWMVLWSLILVLLLICVLLAMIDAVTSLAGYRRAVPEAARRSFSSQNK